ncbi:sulfite exporter TauE/SafE family protein [Rhodobacteraceae bacterium]|nr:sulfite exporter TauE/SafE family protein [Paracoccaceae bacterium]
METSIAFWIAAIFASIFVGLGKGGLPVVAALAVPSLSLFMSPIAAAGLLLPVYIVSDMFALVAYRKEYDARVLKIAFFGMTLGVLLGGLTAHLILEWLITFLIGLMGTVFALRMLMTRPKDDPNTTVPARYGPGLFWTTIAGFTSFISHNGGPPWQIFTLPLNLPKSVFVGTSVIIFSYVNFIKLFPYTLLGQVTFTSVKTSLYLLVPAAIAVYVGVGAVKVIPEKMFFKIVTWALLLISLKLIWDGLSEGLS